MEENQENKKTDSGLEQFAAKKQSKRKIKRYLYTSAVFFAAAVFAVICFVFFFKVKTVTVEGTSKYSDDLLIIKSGITVGENLYSYSQHEIEQKLILSYPYISSVKLVRRWPDKIILKVTEDTPAFVTTIYGENMILSESTRILEHTKESAESTELCVIALPDTDRALVGNKPVFSENGDYVEKVLKCVFDSPLSDKITYINLESKFGIYFTVGNLYKIKCGNSENFDLKLERTVEILKSGHIPSEVKAEINVSNPDECSAIIGNEANIR